MTKLAMIYLINRVCKQKRKFFKKLKISSKPMVALMLMISANLAKSSIITHVSAKSSRSAANVSKQPMQPIITES